MATIAKLQWSLKKSHISIHKINAGYRVCQWSQYYDICSTVTQTVAKVLLSKWSESKHLQQYSQEIITLFLQDASRL